MVLGEDVSSIENTLKLAGVSLSEGLHPGQQIDIHSQYHKVDLKLAGTNSSPLDGGSRLARGSAADLHSLNKGDGIFKRRSNIPHQDSKQRDGSSSKRKRVNSRSDTQSEYAHRGGGFEKCRSRDQMPPPPTPVQQPFVYGARVPSSDLHKGNTQYNHANAISIQRTPITPQRHPSEVGFSRLTLAPGSSIEPSNRLLAGARANNGHSHVDHHHSQHVNAGAVGPVYVRGGWQPPPESFDTAERSENFCSPSSSLPIAGRLPIRRPTGYQRGSLTFPVELGDRSIDPSSRNYQSVIGDGSSSYYRRQSPLAMQFQLESPAHLRTDKLSSSREGRITSRTPSLTSQHSSNKGIGLSSHVGSSGRRTNHQSANSSSRHMQPVIAFPAPQRVSASAYFPTRQRSSLFSLSGSYTKTFRRKKSLESGPRPVNGEMRPHSSTNGEFLVLTQDSRAAQTHSMAHFMESQASGARRRANRR